MTNHDELMLIGNLARAFIENARVDDTYNEIIAAYGFDKIGDDDWVSVARLQQLIHTLVEKRNSFDSTFDLVAVGMRAAENAVLPDGMTLVDFLEAQNGLIDQIYSGPDKAIVNLKKLSDSHYIIETNLPWSEDIMYGNYYGYTRRLLPDGTPFTLTRLDVSEHQELELAFELEWE